MTIPNQPPSYSIKPAILSHYAHEMGKTVSVSVQKVNERIQFVISEIFRLIAHYAANCRDFILNIMWPYEPSDEDELGLFSKILDEGLRQASEKRPAPIEPQETPIAPVPLMVSTPLTGAYLATSYGAIPFQLTQVAGNSDSGFTATVITAQITQSIVLSFFRNSLNRKFLQDYQLESQLDPIDQCLYQGGVIATAKGLDLLTFGTIHRPLQFATAAITIFPPVQQAAFRLPFVHNISQQVHRRANQARDFAKGAIRPWIKGFMIRQARARLVPLIQKMERKGREKLAEKEEENLGFSISNFFLDGRMGDVTRTIVEHHLGEHMQNAIVKAADEASDVMAGMVVDKTVAAVKNTIELYFFNQALSATYQRSPILAGISLIAGGGPQQSVRELALRISGVAVMIMTGSTFLPLAVIYTPNVVDYCMTLRKRQIKRKGWESDPAVDVVKKALTTLARWTILYFSAPQEAFWDESSRGEEIKVSSPKVEEIVDEPTSTTQFKDQQNDANEPTPNQTSNGKAKKPKRAFKPLIQPNFSKRGLYPFSGNRLPTIPEFASAFKKGMEKNMNISSDVNV